MKKTYHIVSRDAQSAAATLEQFTQANGQFLLPLVELITQARVAVDEVISTVGRQTIETILTLSAQEVAGKRTPGKASGDIRWHGSQTGRVMLADRQMKVKRPRLRHKREGEVPVPAYAALQDNGATAQRMMGALLRGVSTRQYEDVLPEMAETAGVSRSSVSRQAIRRQRRTTAPVAGTPLGRSRSAGDLSMGSASERTTSSARWALTAEVRNTFWGSNWAPPKMRRR